MGNGYYSIMRVTDYGPYITKLVLPVDGMVKSTRVNAKQFCVYSERLDANGKVLKLPKSWMALDDKEPSCGYVPLTDVYASNLDGEKCETGNCIALCLAYGPTMQLTSAICAPEGVNVYITNHFVITQTAEIETDMGMMSGKVCNLCLGRKQPDLDGWLLGKTEHPIHPLRYGYFVPQSTQEKNRSSCGCTARAKAVLTHGFPSQAIRSWRWQRLQYRSTSTARTFLPHNAKPSGWTMAQVSTGEAEKACIQRRCLMPLSILSHATPTLIVNGFLSAATATAAL